ncbi:DegV family protein [Dellaglioa sp. L3N]
MREEKIAILVDSGSDIPKDFMAQEHIYMVPILITFSDTTYLDRISISPAEVYERMETEIPTTATPAGGAINDIFEQIKADGYTHVIATTISSGLSGTYNAIKTFAKLSPLTVEIIDTKNIGIGSGLAGIFAANLIKEGDDFGEIVTKVQLAVDESSVFFYVPTLHYLQVGGRIGRVAGLMGNLLNIKPIISCDDNGIYYPIAKARGEKAALKKFLSLVDDKIGDAEHFDIAVAYGNNETLAASILEKLKTNYPNAAHFYFGDVSPALGVHAGPGVIGIGVEILD